MIEAEHLVKRYGPVAAVSDVSFRLERGRVIGVLGPNGAGKSTTLKMVIGYLPPTSGTARVGGIDVVRAPLAVRRCVGYLPESTPLSAEMRVREYLRFRADLAGVARRRRGAAIDAAIERCALVDVARRPIRHLSKGYRQRVGLAAAIVHEPALLVLDEPTVGLDPSQIRDFRALVRSLAGERTVLYSTHILAEAELACDDVLMIHGGRLAAQGSVEALLRGGPTALLLVTDLPRAAERIAAHAGVKSARERSESAGKPVASGLDVADDAQTSRDAQAPRGPESRAQSWHTIEVQLASSDEDRPGSAQRTAAEIVASIVGWGGRVASVQRQHRTLEQVFVEVSRRVSARADIRAPGADKGGARSAEVSPGAAP